MAHEFAESDGVEVCKPCMDSDSGDCPAHPHIGAVYLSDFLMDVEMELYRARLLFPSTESVALAVGEEVGEVYKAHLQGSRADIKKECVQACAMLIRLALEGDSSVAGVRARRKLDR